MVDTGPEFSFYSLAFPTIVQFFLIRFFVRGNNSISLERFSFSLSSAPLSALVTTIDLFSPNYFGSKIDWGVPFHSRSLLPAPQPFQPRLVPRHSLLSNGCPPLSGMAAGTGGSYSPSCKPAAVGGRSFLLLAFFRPIRHLPFYRSVEACTVLPSASSLL